MPVPRDLYTACRTVESDCPDSSARTYARALRLDGNWMTDDERSMQVTYILSNTSYWRGPTAAATKTILRKYEV